MNDLVNLLCLLIISIIIFKLILDDNKKIEKFQQKELIEFNCDNIIDDIINGFFNKYKKENKFNENKLNKYLEIKKYNSKNDLELVGMKINNRNIFDELLIRNLIKNKDPNDSANIKNLYVTVDENQKDINPIYIFNLLIKDTEELNEVIIKVTKNSEVFDSGIIDIGKISVNSK